MQQLLWLTVWPPIKVTAYSGLHDISHDILHLCIVVLCDIFTGKFSSIFDSLSTSSHSRVATQDKT